MKTDVRRTIRGRDTDWQREAACRETDSSVFYHPPGERGLPHAARERAAQAVCAGCPVREQCREYALAAGEVYGVWGGMTEEQRQQQQVGHSRTHRRRASAAGRVKAR